MGLSECWKSLWLQGLLSRGPQSVQQDLGTSGRPLGGSWVAISGVISPLIWVRIIVTSLITLAITAPEPPSWA